MKSEIKDIPWLKGMFKETENKDVEHNDVRGPISRIRVNGPLVVIDLSWCATYNDEGWVKRGDKVTIQFLHPKVELLDGKMIRLTSANEYCVIFFGYDCIVPIIPANN